MRKRIVSFALCFCMIAGLLPALSIPALAATTEVTTEAALRTALTNAKNGDIITIPAGTTIELKSPIIVSRSSAQGVTKITLQGGNGATIKAANDYQRGTSVTNGALLICRDYIDFTIDNLIFDGNGKDRCIEVDTDASLGFFTLKNSTVQNGINTAYYGGGVLITLNNGEMFRVENTTFKNNTGKEGGGFMSSSGGVMKDITITGNTATDKGGGMVSSASETNRIKMQGKIIIDGNTLTDGTANDLYIYLTCQLVKGGTLTAGSRIGVSGSRNIEYDFITKDTIMKNAVASDEPFFFSNKPKLTLQTTFYLKSPATE